MEPVKIALYGNDPIDLQIVENKIRKYAKTEYKENLQIDPYNTRNDLNMIAGKYDVICLNDRVIDVFAIEDKKEVVLSLKRKIKTYYVDDIYYVEADMKYVRICMESSDVREQVSFHKMVELLQEEPFLQIHRSYLVNCKYIKSIDDCVAYMKNGSCLPISKYRKLDVYKQWNDYLQAKNRE